MINTTKFYKIAVWEKMHYHYKIRITVWDIEDALTQPIIIISTAPYSNEFSNKPTAECMEF
jgi:hypothetical protein